MVAWNYYWNNIEDWADNSGTNIELYDTVPNHEEMHKECIRYDNWIHAKTDPSVVSQDVINILRNNFEDAPSMKWDGGKFVPDTIWKRWFAVPNAEHFPSIHKFLEDNKHQYHLSVISKLGPGGVILPHTHKLIDKGDFVVGHTVFNMCINYPRGCRFAMYPTGLIPYKPGDIYKLNVHEGQHSVINNTNQDRYHLMMRPKNV